MGAEKPIRPSSNIFSNAVYNDATLYIPAGTVSLYKNCVPWNKFFNIVGIDFTSIDNVETDNNNAVYYDLSGRAVENPTSGIYIVNGKRVLIK